MISEKQILQKLNGVLQNITEVSPIFFAATLYEFLHQLYHHEKSEDIDAYAFEQKNKSMERYGVAQKELLHQLRLVQNEIERYCYERNITFSEMFTDNCGNPINEYQAYEQRNLIPSGDIVDELIKIVSKELTYLLLPERSQQEVLNFVQQFATVDPFIMHWNNEKQRLDRIKTATFWYSWQELQQFYVMYHDGEARLKKSLEDGDVMLSFQLSDDIEKIKGMAVGKESGCAMALKYHLQRVIQYCKTWISHGFLVGKISLVTEPDRIATIRSAKTRNTIAPIISSYESITGILTINTTSLKFEPTSMRGTLLTFLFKKNKSPVKHISLEKFYAKKYNQKMGSFILKKDSKDAIYHACDGINIRVKKHTGLTNYLLIEKTNISLSKAYSR